MERGSRGNHEGALRRRQRDGPGHLPGQRAQRADGERHLLGGCFYIITYGLSRKMEEIRDNPTVALSGDWFTCHGEAASLGWFGREENKALAAHLRQAFASWIDNGHNDFSDENTIILQVRVTDALLLSHGRRFEK